jgi:hypothetical protein
MLKSKLLYTKTILHQHVIHKSYITTGTGIGTRTGTGMKPETKIILYITALYSS